MTDDMLSWLRAQIESDLMRALSMPRGPWHVMRLGDKGYPQRISNGRALLIAELYEEGPNGTPVADHIAVHDSQGTIARCEAELREIELILATPHVVVDDGWFSCSQARDVDGKLSCYDEKRAGLPCDCGRDEVADLLLRVKASGYRHRPGWNPSWSPVSTEGAGS